MKKISRFLYAVLFWLPFAFAVFLSWEMLSNREAAWPAFYSFLPMTFFFVGVAFMELAARIRRIENRLESKKSDDVSSPSLTSGETVFENPDQWSRAAVGTWPRFWLMAVFFVAWPFVIAHMAIQSGWRMSTITTALFLGFYQLLFLYALRRATVANTRGKSSGVA